jgi:hypothetical protein
MTDKNEEGQELLKPQYPAKKKIARRTICKAI